MNTAANDVPETAAAPRKSWVEPVLIRTEIRTTAAGTAATYGEGVATPYHFAFGDGS
jgi:hypothetical protein